MSVFTARLLTVLFLCTACQVTNGGGSAAATDQPGVHERHPDDGQSDHTVDAWLDRIEARSAAVKSLHAQLMVDRIQNLVGDRQRRFGTMVYDAGPPGRFAVHFDRLLVDRRLDHDQRHYVFDGQWLVERYEKDKLYIKRQVVAPRDGQASAGDRDDPLALGTGPFVVPVQLKKASLLKRFSAELVGLESDGSSTTIHLRLVPKPGHAIAWTQVDLWYDHQTLLPRRARTIDDSENESVVVLSDVRVDEPVDASVIDTSVPTDRGWRIEIKPWNEKGSGVFE